KGVRGRSFFLQMLADCVVRRLLTEMGNLPITNAIYVAGGSFFLLGPTGVSQQIRDLSVEISSQMLDLFHTDIAMNVVTQECDAADIANPKQFGIIHDTLRQ